MVKLFTEVSVTRVKELEGLIDVMVDNIESLPQPVVDALQRLCDGNAAMFDCDYLKSVGVSPCGVVTYVNGIERKEVVRADRISRKVHFTKSEPVAAESFWIYEGSKPICGWGDKPSLATEE